MSVQPVRMRLLGGRSVTTTDKPGLTIGAMRAMISGGSEKRSTASAPVEGVPSSGGGVERGSIERAARLRVPESTLIAVVLRGASLTVIADQRWSLPSGCISAKV